MLAAVSTAAADAPNVTTTAVAFDSPSPNGRHEIPATLLKPDGPGPFAAIVILHDCSGLGERSSGAPHRWADVLVRAGFVVLIPDSFTPRGIPNGVCLESATSGLSRDERRAVSHPARAYDAHAAKAYLQGLAYVDAARIGVMGGSHGGTSTLAAMVRGGPGQDANTLGQNGDRNGNRNGFAAGIALYPSCGVNLGDWRVTRQSRVRGPVTGYSGVFRPAAPVLILIGERDDWTPAAHCQQLAERSAAADEPVSIKVYPGAHHSFDSSRPEIFNPNRNNINMPNGKGATTGGNRTAWSDSIVAATAFFAQYLKPF
ncbi:MAG: dienelactone hydrolase family protein [Alphaproteobacteria bacterium]